MWALTMCFISISQIVIFSKIHGGGGPETYLPIGVALFTVCFFLHWPSWHWQMLHREAIQHCKLQICLLACTSLFSIKCNVLKLDTAQKVYSVNKGLFLVFLSMVRIHGQVPRCDLSCFNKLCWDIQWFKVLVGY